MGIVLETFLRECTDLGTGHCQPIQCQKESIFGKHSMKKPLCDANCSISEISHLYYTQALWTKSTNLKSTEVSDCRGKNEIISETGWACGTTCLLLIICSFHLYPCRFAPIDTVNVMHTIWRRLLQRFMSTMVLRCVWCSSVPGNLHHFTTDETTWMSVKTNMFFSPNKFSHNLCILTNSI